MCAVLGVSRSGYYSWKNRDDTEKEKRLYDLKRKIEDIFMGSRKTYGSPRVFQVLKGMGIKICEDSVADLMRDMGLMAKTKKKFKVNTTLR